MRKILSVFISVLFIGSFVCANEPVSVQQNNKDGEIYFMENNDTDKIAANNEISLSIKKTKSPSVAGMFYTADKTQLQNQINEFKKNSKNTYITPTRAVIVPHAGLVYSGRLAYEGISQLDKNLKNIFIFAPAHRVAFEGIALTSYDAWATPLGEININKDITKELISKFGGKYNDNALAPEHAIEVEIPFIQTVFKDVKIIPVLIGKEDYDKVYKIISYYYPNPENGFVISSDLSHYLPDDRAKKVDGYTAQLIETCTTNNFSHELACGATGILGLIQFANEKNYSLIRIDMANSSDATFERDRVVGYGCWFLYEGDRNEFIKENYSDFIINLCKDSIKNKNTNSAEIVYPKVLSEYGAVFVTLEKFGNLRGCIGSIIPHRPLIDDIIINAQNAAYSDTRFRPVEKGEIKDLKIAVSLLSVPKQMHFKDEEDLLNQIRPNIDGIIIKDGNYQAVYLPSVWEQLPDKRDFLNSLKVKAGLPASHFSKTFEAYRFETSYIKEH